MNYEICCEGDCTNYATVEMSGLYYCERHARYVLNNRHDAAQPSAQSDENLLVPPEFTLGGMKKYLADKAASSKRFRR